LLGTKGYVVVVVIVVVVVVVLLVLKVWMIILSFITSRNIRTRKVDKQFTNQGRVHKTNYFSLLNRKEEQNNYFIRVTSDHQIT
jgi:hypothetical protein